MFVTIWKLTEVIKQYISTALISVFLTAAKVLLPILQAALILMRLPDSALQLQAVYTFTAHLMLMFIMLQVKISDGESLSIKGNYRAYLQPLLNYSLSGGKDLRDVGFTDYGHLRLADHFNDGNPLVYAHKADYINFYQSEYGGLTIPAGINISEQYEPWEVQLTQVC